MRFNYRSTWCWRIFTERPVRNVQPLRATRKCWDSVLWLLMPLLVSKNTASCPFFVFQVHCEPNIKALPPVWSSAGLLSLSVKGAEVASMTMDVIQSIPNLDWLSVWIKAHAFIHGGDNQRAISTIWWRFDTVNENRLFMIKSTISVKRISQLLLGHFFVESLYINVLYIYFIYYIF